LGEFEGFLGNICTISVFTSQIGDTRRWRGSPPSPKETRRVSARPLPNLGDNEKEEIDKEADELLGRLTVEGAVKEGKMDELCTAEKLNEQW